MQLLMRNPLVGIVTLAALLYATGAMGATVTESFDGFPAGKVIAGDLPGGGTASGTDLANVTVSVVNAGGGPNSAIIFDSNNPTGGDPDLGTPNQTCGGPGVGSGGEQGQPYENCVAYNNLLIVAEDIVDTGGDGFVDDPDDEVGGGAITFTFDAPVIPLDIVILDIDAAETADVEVSNNVMSVVVSATSAGNNSAQTIDLSGKGAITELEVEFSGSGAIAELRYETVSTATEETSWGGVKELFR
ncbi:MAG: hypothetical protein HKN20_04600 [Gemmatimonadetes bacterium]|nr:hypothetical protein [Gemmatimonadota bacterium]